jgi:hypothetical protein
VPAPDLTQDLGEPPGLVQHGAIHDVDQQPPGVAPDQRLAVRDRAEAGAPLVRSMTEARGSQQAGRPHRGGRRSDSRLGEAATIALLRCRVVNRCAAWPRMS